MSQPKKVLLNSFIYTFLALLQKPLVFVIVSINSTFLAKDDFAKIALLMTMIELFSRCYLLGLPNAGTRFTATFQNSYYEMHRLWSSLFLMVAALAVGGFLILLWGHHYLLDPFLTGIPFYPYVALASICSIFSATYMLYQRQYQAKQKSRQYSVNVLGFYALYVSSIAFFVAYLKLGAMGALLGFILSNGVFALKAWVSNFRSRPLVFCQEKAWHALKYSLPLFPHTVFAWFMCFADRFFIHRYIGDAAGDYSIAFQLSMVIDTFTMGVYQAFQPWFFSLFEKNQEDCEEVTQFTAFTALLYSFAGLAVSSFSKELCLLLFREDYHMTWRYVPLLCCAQVVRGNYLFYLTALLSRNTFLVSIITVVTALLNVALNMLLIPYWGVMGACLAAFITHHLLGGMCIGSCKVLYKVSFRLRKVIGITYSFFVLSLLNLYPVSLAPLPYFLLKLVLLSSLSSLFFFFYHKELKLFWKKIMRSKA